VTGFGNCQVCVTSAAVTRPCELFTHYDGRVIWLTEQAGAATAPSQEQAEGEKNRSNKKALFVPAVNTRGPRQPRSSQLPR